MGRQFFSNGWERTTVDTSYRDTRTGERGVWLSIFAYAVLSACKLLIGFTAGSEALAADGWNNVTDIAASVAVLIGLRISRKPADRDHRYGHYRAETVAALIASFLMAAVGLQVLFDSATKLGRPAQAAPDPLAAWTALACAVVMYAVFLYNRRIAERINSQAVRAAAQDNRSDALVSVGAFVGILGAQYGMPWLDPFAAIVVGALICKTAWDIFRDATHSLTDGFDDEKLQEIKKTIGSTKGVKGIVDLKARALGNQTYVDVTVTVNPHLSVIESHAITERIEAKINEKHDVSNVHIHIEPMLEDER
ncbi:cation diffusion facilitator family transporter [Paenibacillus antri]|uniref:cation diffusion facilitator family transporter n=1 Tax=Paenibacillus antri TaxID=2582848 RepID=UPI00192E6600